MAMVVAGVQVTQVMIHRRRRAEVHQSCCRPPAEAGGQIQGEPGSFFGLEKPDYRRSFSGRSSHRCHVLEPLRQADERRRCYAVRSHRHGPQLSGPRQETADRLH